MKIYINKETSSFGIYGNFVPSSIDLNEWVEITEAQYNEYSEKTNNGYDAVFDFDKKEFIYTKHEPTPEEKKAELRIKREPLLKAFDIYKTNVSYGVEVENEETHNSIIVWYHDILDLNEEAINNPPSVITRYM